MEPVIAASALAVINTTLVDALKAPVVQRYPDIDLWWFVYVNFLAGLGLNWLAQVNVFSALFASDLAGVLLTGFFVGGGSKMLYDVIIDPQQARARMLESK